jgi:flagellar motor switch protein FliN/FliY
MSENQTSETDVKSLRKVKLQELDQQNGEGSQLFGDDINLIQDVKVRLSVSVGSCELTVRDLFGLREDSLLQLNKRIAEPLDIFLDDKLVARGSLVAVDDDFGIKITEILRPEQRE